MSTGKRRVEDDDASSDEDDDDASPSQMLTGEESYRGAPMADFETSRADAVLAFKQGASRVSLCVSGLGNVGVSLDRVLRGLST